MSMGFNRRWVGSPAYIQVVRSAAETITAVQRRVRRGPAHHGAWRRALLREFSADGQGGVIVDLSGMQDVQAAPDGTRRWW